jgi:hypothetical protein
MRTTVTLENDVARMLDDHARRTRKSFKETLNEAVRLGLSHASNPAAYTDFVIDAREMGLRSGIDGARFDSLLDEMDADAFLESHTGGGK